MIRRLSDWQLPETSETAWVRQETVIVSPLLSSQVKLRGTSKMISVFPGLGMMNSAPMMGSSLSPVVTTGVPPHGQLAPLVPTIWKAVIRITTFC